MSTSDLDTLVSIFENHPLLPPQYLQQILTAHAGDVSRACHYILNLTDGKLTTKPDYIHDYTTFDSAFQPTRPDIQPARIDLSDTAQATRLIENVKDIVVPALKSQLSGLAFPDLSGEADRVKYSLSGLKLSSITLQPQHVTVVVTDERDLHIVATDIAVAVDVGQWTYRLKFPPIRDAGRAHAEFFGVRADILLKVNERNGSMTVSNCECSIDGAISFRANDAKLSWLYNTLAPILRNAFRPSLEATLTQGIRTGLEQQLDDWSSWTMET